MSEVYKRKVKVLCVVCKKESDTELVFGEDKRYPDDFHLECPKCDNWEAGSLPTQNFEVLKEY